MNLKQHTLITLLALAGTLTLPPLARCGDAQAPAQPAAAAPAAGLRERLQQLAADLNLSDEQREKIQSILRDRLDQLRELRQDASLSQAEKVEKFKSMREDIAAEVRKLLSPDQIARLKEKPTHLLGAAQGPLEQLQEGLKRLNLTEEQKEKLKPLYQEQLEKLRALRQDASLSLQEKLDKLKGMRQEVAPELKKVLDPAQFEEWQKGMDRWLEGVKQRLQAAPGAANQQP